MNPLFSKAVLTIFAFTLVCISSTITYAQVIDEAIRTAICKKAERLIAERETLYNIIVGSLGACSEQPALPMAPAVQLQKEIRGLLGENHNALKTDLTTSLPFSIVNLHNNLLALNYLRLKYPNHPNYKDLVNRYEAELEANGAVIGKICGELEPPSGLLKEIQTQFREDQAQAKDKFYSEPHSLASEKARIDKCFEGCEEAWREIIDPRYHLEFLTEVAKCKNACLSSSHQ